MVGRLHPRRRQNRTTTAISRAWLRVGNDATASEEISREPFESSESRQTATAVHAPIRRLCGPVLRTAVLPNAQSIYSTALSPNAQHSPYTCIWRISASRNWNRRPTAVCVAENEKRPVMGIRESFPQSNVEGLRISEEVELPLRRESGSWCFTSREGSGSRKARTYARPDTTSSRTAQGARTHHGAAGHLDGDAGGRNSWTAPKGRGLYFGTHQDRTVELSRCDWFPEDQRQQTFVTHPHWASHSSCRYMWTSCKNRRRVLCIPELQWKTTQRFQPTASTSKTSRKEIGCTVVELAHAQAHARYIIASVWRVTSRCTSPARPQQDVHNVRDLHTAHSRTPAGSGGKPFAIGDEW